MDVSEDRTLDDSKTKDEKKKRRHLVRATWGLASNVSATTSVSQRSSTSGIFYNPKPHFFMYTFFGE